jgi:hypothetical protein
VGYLTYGPDAANVLFQVVNERYLHQRPMVFTTNKPLPAWGRVLHDPDLAEAILDRVLERGRHLDLRGLSYRTRHLALDRGQISTAPQRDRPEFPEITGQNFWNPQHSQAAPSPAHPKETSNSCVSGSDPKRTAIRSARRGRPSAVTKIVTHTPLQAATRPQHSATKPACRRGRNSMK